MKTNSVWAGALTLSGALVTHAAVAGPAEDQAYISGFVGIQAGSETKSEGDGLNASADIDPGIAGGGAIGVGFADPFGAGGAIRTEAEVSIRRGQVDGTDERVRTLTFFGNAWYDVATGTNFSPYVGGGVGLGKIAGGLNPETGLGWQLGGGVNVGVSDEVFAGLNYRYVRAKISDLGIDTYTNSNQVTFSITVPFTKIK